jgi:hypothetical protein
LPGKINKMSINYNQLKNLVLQELVGDGPGGVMGPSAPAGIPHREPASQNTDQEHEMGDPEANEKYAVALTAREATEQLVETLDQPIYDGAYEHAFKASACLRRALNELVNVGAHPMPVQHVVAAPRQQQKYTAGTNMGDYAAGVGGYGDTGGGMMEEGLEDPEVQKAIQAYEVLDEDQVELFKAYFTGDAETGKEGAV